MSTISTSQTQLRDLYNKVCESAHCFLDLSADSDREIARSHTGGDIMLALWDRGVRFG